ncbi:MAG: hypothetical protein QME51_01065 [Planctomycetota bacterium]|nr:hypothetical protein [Planctomycetota bacterium]
MIKILSSNFLILRQFDPAEAVELLPGIVGCNASAHPDIHRGADANSHTTNN